MSYTVNEGILPLPGSWQDQSMNVLMPVLSDVQGANLLISRDLLPAGAPFSDYLATQKKKFKRELNNFKSTLEQPCRIDGREAEYWEFNWKQESIVIWQLILVVLNGSQVLTLTYTSPTTLPDETKETVRSAMLLFKFRSPDAAERA